MSLVEFKSWWGDWSGSDKLPENTDIIYAFEAGQQSQQGEVDKLQTEIDEITKQRDSFIKAHHISMNDVCEHKDKIDEVNEKHSEEVLNTLNENGYVILPTDELSEEDKKQRKTPNISFIVKSTNLEK